MSISLNQSYVTLQIETRENSINPAEQQFPSQVY